MLDPGLVAAIVSGALLVSSVVIAGVMGRNKDGMTVAAAATPHDVQVVDSMVASLAETLAAQGRQIASLNARVSVMEDRESALFARIEELERWGSMSQEPIPRPVPIWQKPVVP